jgi:hypothetical protein
VHCQIRLTTDLRRRETSRNGNADFADRIVRCGGDQFGLIGDTSPRSAGSRTRESWSASCRAETTGSPSRSTRSRSTTAARTS